MRLIAMDYFARSPLLAYPVLALAIFMGIFLMISVRAVLTQKNECDDLARLPLGKTEEKGTSDVCG